MTTSSPHRGISRIDSGSTHGWFVRAYRNNKTYSKFFSDSVNGGRESALAAAQQHHGALLSRLAALPPTPRARRLVARDARNATGVIGVCRTIKRSANGKASECFSVSWRPAPGVQKCTSFSIRKYGEAKAWRLAVQLRWEKMREIHGSAAVRRLRRTVARAPDHAQLAPPPGRRALNGQAMSAMGLHTPLAAVSA